MVKVWNTNSLEFRNNNKIAKIRFRLGFTKLRKKKKETTILIIIIIIIIFYYLINRG